MGYSEQKPLSVAAIVGTVLGAIAVLTSFMPIINNGSFILALVGVVVAVVGLVGVLRGKKRNKPLAFIALALNVVAIVMVLATQSMYSAAIDDATNGPAVTSTSESDHADQASDDQAADQASDANATNLSVGTAATLDNGLTVSVDSVATGLTNFDGTAVTCVRVTYTNGGSESVSFNEYDWKGEDVSGARRDNTYYGTSDGSETGALGYGDLAAGGSVSGNVYFEGDIAGVLYFGNALSDDPAATWVLA